MTNIAPVIPNISHDNPRMERAGVAAGENMLVALLSKTSSSALELVAAMCEMESISATALNFRGVCVVYPAPVTRRKGARMSPRNNLLVRSVRHPEWCRGSLVFSHRCHTYLSAE